jgi:osmoprotectant transport system substrate-binding protein
MIKKLVLICAALAFFHAPAAEACVGKVLRIGAIDSNDGNLLPEMLALMINERTGSTVTIIYYRDTTELYDAVKAQQIDILIENTTRALKVLNRPEEADRNKTYAIVKATYEKEKGLIWLKPFGYLSGRNGEAAYFVAPVMKTETLNNFPALPRVIDKLGNILNDEVYAKMLGSVNSGAKPKNVVRELLKTKKLI